MTDTTGKIGMRAVVGGIVMMLMGIGLTAHALFSDQYGRTNEGRPFGVVLGVLAITCSGFALIVGIRNRRRR